MSDKVVVLMSTYNGEKYLREQIDSILNQENVDITLIARDDGSTDNTISILKEYKKKNKLFFYVGVNKGPAKSFIDLINSSLIDENLSNTFFAFSDQDDIWKKDKLSRAVKILKSNDYSSCPSLYCADFQRVDENGIKINNTFHYTTSTFKKSIVCSYCTGCTMVFNDKLFFNLKNRKPDYLLMHDDWIHKVCLAIGGKVFFDSNYRAVLYRQHASNVVGSQTSILSKFISLYKRFHKNGDCMLNQYTEIMKMYNDEIPDENKKILNVIIDYKDMGIFERIKLAFNDQFKLKPTRLTKEFRIGILIKKY